MEKQQTKKYLAEALIYLMKNKPFNLITNKNITDKAGFSHITYYRYFKSKNEIIKYYLDDITNEFIHKTKINYQPKYFKEYLITLFYHLKEKENIGLLLYKAGLIHYIKDEFDKIFQNKAKTTKEKYNYSFVAGGLYNVYYYWLINGSKETPEQLANMFMDFFTLK